MADVSVTASTAASVFAITREATNKPSGRAALKHDDGGENRTRVQVSGDEPRVRAQDAGSETRKQGGRTGIEMTTYDIDDVGKLTYRYRGLARSVDLNAVAKSYVAYDPQCDHIVVAVWSQIDPVRHGRVRNAVVAGLLEREMRVLDGVAWDAAVLVRLEHHKRGGSDALTGYMYVFEPLPPVHLRAGIVASVPRTYVDFVTYNCIVIVFGSDVVVIHLQKPVETAGTLIRTVGTCLTVEPYGAWGFAVATRDITNTPMSLADAAPRGVQYECHTLGTGVECNREPRRRHMWVRMSRNWVLPPALAGGLSRVLCGRILITDVQTSAGTGARTAPHTVAIKYDTATCNLDACLLIGPASSFVYDDGDVVSTAMPGTGGTTSLVSTVADATVDTHAMLARNRDKLLMQPSNAAPLVYIADACISGPNVFVAVVVDDHSQYAVMSDAGGYNSWGEYAVKYRCVGQYVFTYARKENGITIYYRIATGAHEWVHEVIPARVTDPARMYVGVGGRLYVPVAANTCIVFDPDGVMWTQETINDSDEKTLVYQDLYDRVCTRVTHTSRDGPVIARV